MSDLCDVERSIPESQDGPPPDAIAPLVESAGDRRPPARPGGRRHLRLLVPPVRPPHRRAAARPARALAAADLRPAAGTQAGPVAQRAPAGRPAERPGLRRARHAREAGRVLGRAAPGHARAAHGRERRPDRAGPLQPSRRPSRRAHRCRPAPSGSSGSTSRPRGRRTRVSARLPAPHVADDRRPREAPAGAARARSRSTWSTRCWRSRTAGSTSIPGIDPIRMVGALVTNLTRRAVVPRRRQHDHPAARPEHLPRLGRWPTRPRNRCAARSPSR